MALLRELADENAYQRHLTAHGRAHSGEEWRRFSEERLCAKICTGEVLLRYPQAWGGTVRVGGTLISTIDRCFQLILFGY